MDSAIKSANSIEQRIKAEAFRLGFSLCGITTAAPPAGFTRYESWLKNGYQAGMSYLSTTRHRELRREPALLAPGVQTILSLVWAYPLRSMQELHVSDQAFVAGYTSGFDYHITLPEKLTSLAQFIHGELGETIEIHGFTDSAPILEREIAVRAGLGWIGRNSCLVSPRIGSSFLLAELFINALLEPDPPFKKDFCGTCKRCLEACPTGCILPDRTIDSTRCISYLTIEHRGAIPEPLRPLIGTWLFGCDSCQMVCPWNRKSYLQKNITGPASFSLDQAIELLSISPADFNKCFGENALSRVKSTGLIRNVLIFLGNFADPSTIPHLQRFLNRNSDNILAETANWALDQFKVKKTDQQ